MKLLRLATCACVIAALSHVASAQPADDAGVPPAAEPPDAGVPVEVKPAPSPPAAPPGAMPPLPPPSAPPQVERKAPYPIARVDRPLVMPSGATRFDPSFQLVTYDEEVVELSGNPAYRRTGFFDHTTPDLSVSHVFGPVEVGIALGFLARVYAVVAVGSSPLALSAGGSFSGPQKDDRYLHSQYVAATYKHLAIPHRLAVVARFSLALDEARVPLRGTFVEGVITGATASMYAEVQLSCHWSLYGGLRDNVPVYMTADFDAHVLASAFAGGALTFRRWDFFIDGSVGVERHPDTFLNIGFAKRWGI